MKIATIFEKDIYPEREAVEGIEYADRVTGKAIMCNAQNQIALVGNEQNEYLQLPGGGIDAGESIEKGIIRECLEETGYSVTNPTEVGVIDDYRSRDKKHCINYCYVVQAVGEQTKTARTENEVNIGMFTKWISITEALHIFKKQKQELEAGRVAFYNTGFNIVRDLMFLESALSEKKIHE